jgi:hypothetical protein
LQQLQHVSALGYDLTYGQQHIIGAVLDPQVKRLIISCMTRYGKTRIVAIALLLYILDNNNKRILIIAPTIDQTNIIRNYMAELIAKNKTLSDLVDHRAHTGPENLKSEMSKKRITFKNGCELITLTAHGNENESDPAPNLMGFGGDIVVLDEADLILRKVYTQRISRMLGDSPDSKLIDIVNPWNITNFSHEHWLNPAFKKIHVDWRQALAEGRVTESYLKEQKDLLSDYEWTVLYESKWSNESEDTLIRYDWIQRATIKQIVFTGSVQTVWGLDVAEQGADQTILTHAETDEIQYDFKEQQYLSERETMATANRVDSIVPLTEQLSIDSIGVGAGVYSRLTEMKHKTNSIRVGESPRDSFNSKRFMNLKSQRWWHVRELFEKDLIHIPNNPKLISQLSQMRYEFTALSKIKIKDPEGKSPDYADSLMLTLLDSGPKANPSFILK